MISKKTKEIAKSAYRFLVLRNITKYKIKRVEYGKSHHLDLCDLEEHADVEWMKYAFVIILEAEKA